MNSVALQCIDPEANRLSRGNPRRVKRNDSDSRKVKRSGSRNGSRPNLRKSRSNSFRSNSSSVKEEEEVLTPKEIRRRRAVLIVLSTFAFLLICSVLFVVITLTQTVFHSVPNVRQENEKLNEALNRAVVSDDMGGAVSGIIANFTSSSTENTSSTSQNVTTAPP